MGEEATELFILDSLIAESPTCKHFYVPLGEKEDQRLKFKMVNDFTLLQRLKNEANIKAKELYPVLVPEFNPATEAMDEIRLGTIAQCILMQGLSDHPKGQVTIEKLYALSKSHGAVFGGITQIFSTKLAVGEAVAFNKQVDDAKN
jgi:hypothetical protein